MSLDQTLQRLPPGATEYSRRLYDFHWSEAAWLYERREVLTAQGALVSPDRWREIEGRAEAHVAALDYGGSLVLKQCETRALDGDVGELNVAVRLLARADQTDQFLDLVEAMDWYEPARGWAIAEALAWDAPDSWQQLIGTVLADESSSEDALGPLARVAGLRSWPLQDALLTALERQAGAVEGLAWAVGRLGITEALPLLYPLLEQGRAPAVRQAAALAALRFAPGQILAFLEQVLAAEDWAAVPFALTAGASGWEPLSNVARTSPTPDRMLAIGLLGHRAGVEFLLGWLGDPRCGEAAAEGLYLLTGAPLHEVTQQRALDGSDPEDDDRPPGVLVSRLPRSAEIWKAWLDEHGHDRGDARVRGGQTFDLLTTLDELGRTTASARVREWMLEELGIRYRFAVAASPRQLQQAQRVALTRARNELSEREKIQAGAWYRDGQPLRTI